MTQIFNLITSVEFIYTEKCNLRCAHCINECSPEKTGKIDCNKVLAIVKELPKFKIKVIGITGGEPMLFLEEILRIASLAKEKGIYAKTISNGFWGSSKEKAEEIVSKLASAGINSLNISSDEFHSKFIPQKNILNIVDAGKKQKNFKVILRVSLSRNLSLFDFIEKYKDYVDKLNPKEKPLLIFAQPLFPLGRAINLSSKDYMPIKKILKGPCSFLSPPLINYDGRFVLCCTGALAKNSAFELANFNFDSTRQIIESHQKSLFVFYLRKKGPAFLVNLARKHKLKKVNKTKKVLGKYVGLCDYCILNLAQYSKEDINNMLAEDLKKNNELKKIAEKEFRFYKKKGLVTF